MMDLFPRFLTKWNILQTQFPSTNYLLALSGGMDSVCLFHLLISAKIPFRAAHVDFQLRGEESDKDRYFVEKLCAENEIPLEVKICDAKAFALESGISIEMAAREIRYSWFDEILDTKEVLLTAHHASDHLETALINLSRGTGLKGLLGIRNRADVWRPLLAFTKEEIRFFCTQQKLSWREDSSNKDTDIYRNKVRHNIIPILKELNPSLESTFYRNSQRLLRIQNFLERQVEKLKTSFLEKEGYKIPFQCLSDPTTQALLEVWFLEVGLPVEQILDKEEHVSGSKYLGNSCCLWTERGYFFLTATEEGKLSYTIDSIESTNPIVELEEFSGMPTFTLNKLYCPKTHLELPFTLRKWRVGDRMRPFGMKGSKLISDILGDLKIPNYQKENTWVLEKNKEILWLVGLRTSEKTRIENLHSDYLLFTVKT